MILPNHLSTARIILTPIFIFLFLSGDHVLMQISLAVFFVAAITDWYDGWLARKFNYITQMGKFLDPLADKILTASTFFAFAYLDVLPLWMVWVVVIRDFLITALRLIADFKNHSIKTSRFAQWKTFLQMAFIYFLLVFYILRTVSYLYNFWPGIFNLILDPGVVYYSMLIITLITFLSGLQYIIDNRKMIWKILR
ncbi:MAG: CDP-diacylglycerol--glycerol-3-phosphate 3-phosphatidyltransferase [Chlorobi bacterium]|nr:CDP-diacylglycerol--glycerol-3-phosphate 3-phosphatidyltransferase [Chlorobiota bacterium]